MICKVCKKFFIPRKENKYVVIQTPAGISVLTERARIYEAFDCPRCGCQNIVNTREGNSNETLSTPDRSTGKN